MNALYPSVARSGGESYLSVSAFWVYTRTTVDTYVVARVCSKSVIPDEDRKHDEDCEGARKRNLPTVGEASKKRLGFEDLNGKGREEPAYAAVPTVPA